MSYTRVKYIQTNKTFFTTDAYLTANYEAQFECSLVSLRSGSDNLFFGVRENSVTSSYNMVVNAAAARSNWTYYCAGSYNDYCGPYTLNNIYEIVINKTKFKYHDTVADTGNTFTYSGSFSVNTNRFIRIGGCWNYSTNRIDNNNADVRWYEIRFYDDGVLVHKYLPYKDNDTGYGVLYDEITDTFLTANSPSSVIPGEPLFDISPKSLNYDYSGGTSALTIEASDDWSASTNESWITLSSTSGTGNSTINVTVPNNLGNMRSGSITVTDGSNSVICSVGQETRLSIPYNNIFRNGNRIN